jgi:periplasmic glucans biosynthesis protein
VSAPVAPSRRALLAGAAALTAAPAAAQARFDAGVVVRLAERAARRPYVPPPPLSPALAALDYDAYRRIQVRRERMLWAGEGLAFTADLLPRGYLFPQRLDVSVVQDGRATPVATDGLWSAEPAVIAALDGASGLRLQHPLNRPGVYDEVAVFQGGSYFRSLGRDQGYGLSARGLSLGAGDMGEEHPAFIALWLEKPAPGQMRLVLHALLDSPSVAGAYRFVIRPGPTTVFEVTASLFPRRDLADVGLATQTSMFFFAPQDRLGVDDFRDAAHDSDGLALWTAAGERIWRPLANPPSRTRISVFPGRGLRGFGLQQRARALADYNDLEARYDRRPSLWVEPLGDWGEGEVRLVELPAKHEGEDNIAALWRPREPWRAGRRYDLGYRLHWGEGDPAPKPPMTIAATRVGRDDEPGVRRIVVDFRGPASAMETLQLSATADAGTLLNATTAPHPEANTLRATLRFRHPPGGEANLNLHLAREGTFVSELWQYRWTA